MPQRWSRSARVTLAALLFAYLLPGLFGHEPWKPDEPYTFGIVRTMLASHDALVPRVGDLPFVEKPPLFYWVAAATTSAMPMLAPHEAARLASALFVLLTLGATAWAARTCWPEGTAAPAMLLVIATLGLEGHAQRLQVDLALLAGFAVATLGFAGMATQRRWGGLALGIGAGMGFLAKGLLAPGILAIAALLLPTLFAAWRRRGYARDILIAALASAPIILPWPWLLWRRDPALFEQWFWDNNIGRFAGESVARLGAASEPGFWISTLPWFLFPLWVFVAVALVRGRREMATRAGMQIGIAMTLAIGATLLASASGRAIYALPLLPPMALIAADAAGSGASRVQALLRAASLVIAPLAALAVWGVWASLVATGSVPAWTRLGRHFVVPFAMPLDVPLVIVAGALTLGFIALALRWRRLPSSGLMLWTGALALAWGLAMTLWLPWIDAAKSYRDVLTDAARHLEPEQGCIQARGLGESERAMVEYYMRRPVRSAENGTDCPALLWLAKPNTLKYAPAEERWQRVWSGERPGESRERFALFVPRPATRLAGFGDAFSRGSSGTRAARRSPARE